MTADASEIAEQVRRALIERALAAYEDAALQGLCCEGAWEAAVAAMRRQDVVPLLAMGSSADEHAARIRALDAQWLEAAGQRDLDGMMAIYAPDARELLPDVPPLVGKAAIRGFYDTLIRRLPRFAHHFEAHEITVGEAGDLAVVQGTFRFTQDARQPAEVQAGKFVGVWRRLDGDWRLVLNISNSDPPPA